jgi:ribosomal protein S18 acetylase RimI-like enzyme
LNALLICLFLSPGVPDGDPAGCYLLNVVVAENIRGQGVGKRVMRAAMHRAVKHWGAERLYTHVEADNEVSVW